MPNNQRSSNDFPCVIKYFTGFRLPVPGAEIQEQ